MKWFCTVFALTLVVGCGDGDGGPAGPPVGSWRLVGETIGSSTTPEAQLNGALEITATDYALGVAVPEPSGLISTFTLSADGKALVVGGSTTIPFHVSGGMLTLEPEAQHSFTFGVSTGARLETFAVMGTVTVAAGAPAMAAPRAALVFFSRTEPGFVNDIRDDKALAFTGGAAAFDVSRTDSARGTDRITFGLTAGISLAVVVVYDDRDHSGTLDDLFTPCSAATTDCIRGVSPIILGYLDGQSTQLTASPYVYLRPGWTTAVQVTDQRTGADRLGLVATDPEKTLHFDVTVVADPAQVTIPAFDLAQ